MIRTASAYWQGGGKDGSGHLTSASGVLNKTQYSYKSRFEDGPGTNPEELVAAAHAGCFTMKLSFVLGDAGHVPTTLETTCKVTFENGMISKSHLIVNAAVPGISDEEFAKHVHEAEINCPISKSLKSAITSEFKLNS